MSGVIGGNAYFVVVDYEERDKEDCFEEKEKPVFLVPLALTRGERCAPCY
jgi:hypothetical protein